MSWTVNLLRELCGLFPQQRNLMESSAQKSSGVHWCRRWVRCNEFTKKVPKVPEKVWEALVQSQVRFKTVPEKVLEKVPEKVWFRARSGSRARLGSTGFRRRFQRSSREVPEKIPGGFGAEPSQVQQGAEKVTGERCGRLWCKAKSGSTGFPNRFRRRFRRRFREAFVRSQVRLNRIPEKVPEKVWEALVQSQVRFNRVPEGSGERCGRLW